MKKPTPTSAAIATSTYRTTSRSSSIAPVMYRMSWMRPIENARCELKTVMKPASVDGNSGGTM